MTLLAAPGADRRGILLVGIWMLALLSVVSWRPDSLFSGGLDPVVVGKAAVAFAALAAALAYAHRVGTRAVIGPRSTLLLACLVAVSCVGALAAGSPTASLVLAVRIAIVAVTVLVLALSTPRGLLLATLLAAMGILTVVGAITGVPELLADGRLSSGIPAMRPNELAGLAAPPIIGVLARTAQRGLTPARLLMLVSLGGILFLTGSRAALLVVAIAALLVLVLAWPLPTSVTAGMLLLTPAAYALVAFTDVVTEVAIRGQDTTQLLTLSARTFAWEAVLAIPIDSWHKWIGNGLAEKLITVDHPWWDVQPLDSSWVSVLSQAGIIGMGLLIVWVLLTLRDAVRARAKRVLVLPMLVLILVRSIVENGLIESSAIFLVFFLLSVTLEPGYVPPRRVERVVPYALARVHASPAPDRTVAPLSGTESR